MTASRRALLGSLCAAPPFLGAPAEPLSFPVRRVGGPLAFIDAGPGSRYSACCRRR